MDITEQFLLEGPFSILDCLSAEPVCLDICCFLDVFCPNRGQHIRVLAVSLQSAVNLESPPIC